MRSVHHLGNRSPRRLAAAAVAIALATIAVGEARASSAPQHTPKLANMTLKPSDLAPGAHVVGTFTPGSGDVAPTYVGSFEHVSTLDGVKLDAIQTIFTLWPNSASATKTFAGFQIYYESPAGHRAIFQTLNTISRVSHAAFKTARFGEFRSAGVGAQSLFVAVSFPAKPAAVAAGVLFVRVGRVAAMVASAATGSPLADSVTIGLARRVAANISSELAAAASSAAVG